MDEFALMPPVDITIRAWLDRDVEVISPLADWLTCAVLNRALDNYVEFEVTLAPAEDDE